MPDNQQQPDDLMSRIQQVNQAASATPPVATSTPPPVMAPKPQAAPAAPAAQSSAPQGDDLMSRIQQVQSNPNTNTGDTSELTEDQRTEAASQRSEAYKKQAWGQTWRDLKALNLHNAAHDVATMFQNPDQPLPDLFVGMAHDAGKTAHTIGRAVNAATGDNISALPTSFTQPKSLENVNADQQVGGGVEQLAEFMAGGEVVKGLEGLSYVTKVSKLLPYMKQLEESAANGTPLYKLVKAGYETAKMTALSSGQSVLHTPTAEAAWTGAKYGAIGGAVGEGIGAGAEYFKTLTPAAKEAAAATKAAESEAVRGAEATQQNRINIPRQMSNVAQDAAENATGVSNRPVAPEGVSNIQIVPKGQQAPSASPMNPVTPEELETAQRARAYVAKTLDYTFGDAASDIKKHFDPVYDQIRAATGGQIIPETGRYGTNAFDDAVNQVRRAKKVLYSPSPASTGALKTAESELADGQDKINKMFSNNPTAYADAQAGWRKASTLEDLDSLVSPSFEPSKGIRNLTQRVPAADPEKLAAQIDKAFGKLDVNDLQDALGKQGTDNLLGVHKQLMKTLNSENATEAMQRVAKQILKDNPSPQNKGSMGWYGAETVMSILGHFAFAGAHDPAVATMVGSTLVARWAYTHPQQALPILVGLSKAAAPAAVATHIWNADTQQPEAVQQ